MNESLIYKILNFKKLPFKNHKIFIVGTLLSYSSKKVNDSQSSIKKMVKFNLTDH